MGEKHRYQYIVKRTGIPGLATVARTEKLYKKLLG